MENLTPEPPGGWPHSWCNIYLEDGKLEEVLHVNDLWQAMFRVFPLEDSMAVIVYKRTGPVSFVYQGGFKESYEWVKDFIFQQTGNDLDTVRWGLKNGTSFADVEGKLTQTEPSGAALFGIHFWNLEWEHWARTNKEQDEKNAARVN